MRRGHREYYLYRDCFKVWNGCQQIPCTPKYLPQIPLVTFWIKAIASFEMQISSGDEGGRAKETAWWAAANVPLFHFLFTSLCDLVKHLLPKLTDKLRIGSIRRKRKKDKKEELLPDGSFLGMGWRILSTRQAGNATERQGRRKRALCRQEGKLHRSCLLFTMFPGTSLSTSFSFV